MCGGVFWLDGLVLGIFSAWGFFVLVVFWVLLGFGFCLFGGLFVCCGFF